MVGVRSALTLLLMLAMLATAPPLRAQTASSDPATLVPLLEVQDLIYTARVVRGQISAAQADEALKAHAAAWSRQAPPVTEAILLQVLRGEAALLLDHVGQRIATTTTWPADRPADDYRMMAGERLAELRRDLSEAPATQTGLRVILTSAAMINGWTRGRAALSADDDPFADSAERALLAAVPPSRQTGPKALPPNPPAGTLKLAYFGLFDDVVGPREATLNGKADGRFVLTIAVDRLSSTDLVHIALQAMDANSRPIGPIWHTRDASQTLLAVVAGGQWLNTRHVNGLAILEGREIDLILIADGAPDPATVSAFIVEAAFADGSVARQLMKVR